MNCTKSHSLIHLRESGDLTRREENRLDRHLDRCAECREYADGLEPLGLSEIGSDIPFGEDDFAGIRREVLAGLPVARHRNSRRSALQLAFLVAAALVVAIAFIQLRGTSGRNGSPARLAWSARLLL